MKKFFESFNRQGKVPSWAKYIGMGISLAGFLLFWLLKGVFKKDDVTSFIVLIIFFGIGTILFFYLDKFGNDQKKNLEMKVVTFLKTVALALRAGDDLSSSLEKGKKEIGDQKIKEQVDCFLADGTGPLNNSPHKSLLLTLKNKEDITDTVSLATYIEASLIEPKEEKKGMLGYLGLIALVVEMALVLIAVYANNLPK